MPTPVLLVPAIRCTPLALALSLALSSCQERPKATPAASAAASPASAAPTAPTASRAAPKAGPSRVEISLDDMKDGSFLLITHPSRLVVRSVSVLQERKLLSVPGLTVVGVYHEDEYDDYEASRKLLRGSDRPWMRLLEIDCDLDASSLFEGNDCREVFDELQERSVGIVFTGGADIPPALYGERTALTTVIRTPLRQYWELSMLFHLLGRGSAEDEPLLQEDPEYPVLGICMGMQAMNVATGGTLVQDIPSELYGVDTLEAGLELPADQVHRSFDYALRRAPGTWPGAFHRIKFTGKLDFWKQIAQDVEPVKVMSVHHQAVEKVGHDLVVTATSMDGKVPEAVHHERFSNVLGLQFHPEYDVLWDPSKEAKRRPDDGESNPFAKELEADAHAKRFHESFWKHWSARWAASAAR